MSQASQVQWCVTFMGFLPRRVLSTAMRQEAVWRSDMSKK